MIDITGLREDKRPQSSTLVHALLDRLEAAEKERDDVAQQLVQSEIGKREISEAHDALQVEVGKLKELEVSRCVKINGYIVDNARLAEEVERLQAKIEQMEKQEPVRHEFQGRDGVWYPFIDQRHYENTVADGTWPIRALYALPGAKTQGE